MTSGKRWSKFQTGAKAILTDQHGVSSEKAGEYCQHLKRNEEVWHKLQVSAKDVAGNLAADKMNGHRGEKGRLGTVCDVARD